MIKKKNIYVIFTCALIAFLVIISSFLGLIIYWQWRQLRLAYNYYETLEEGDTISYAKNLELSSFKVNLVFHRYVVVTGKIKNSGRKTVASAAIRVDFLDSLGNSVYSSDIYPLEPFHSPKNFRKMRFAYFAFLKGPSIRPSEAVVFRYHMWECPKRFMKTLRNGSFSSKPGEWSGKISAKVVKVKLKP
jgi:hypothetical protein